MRTKLFLSILLSISHCVAAHAETWPGWLGPERNGRVADFEPPTVWPKSLERAWQYDAEAC